MRKTLSACAQFADGLGVAEANPSPCQCAVSRARRGTKLTSGAPLAARNALKAGVRQDLIHDVAVLGAGQYQEAAGATQCWSCIEGETTTVLAADSAADCTCQPGRL